MESKYKLFTGPLGSSCFSASSSRVLIAASAPEIKVFDFKTPNTYVATTGFVNGIYSISSLGRSLSLVIDSEMELFICELKKSDFRIVRPLNLRSQRTFTKNCVKKVSEKTFWAFLNLEGSESRFFIHRLSEDRSFVPEILVEFETDFDFSVSMGFDMAISGDGFLFAAINDSNHLFLANKSRFAVKKLDFGDNKEGSGFSVIGLCLASDENGSGVFLKTEKGIFFSETDKESLTTNEFSMIYEADYLEDPTKLFAIDNKISVVLSESEARVFSSDGKLIKETPHRIFEILGDLKAVEVESVGPSVFFFEKNSLLRFDLL